MNPYGKILRCKGSLLPLSEDPRLNQQRKKTDILHVDSPDQISSEVQKRVMTGEKTHPETPRPYRSNCSRMKNLMNSSLFSWSRLSSSKNLMATPTRNKQYKTSSDCVSPDKSFPPQIDTSMPTGFVVPKNQAYPKSNTFHYRGGTRFGFQTTMASCKGCDRNYAMESNFRRNFNKHVNYQKHYRDMHPYCRKTGDEYAFHHEDEYKWRRNKECDTSKTEKKDGQRCAHTAKRVPSDEIKKNSINMLKDILLQNEIVNSSQTGVCNNSVGLEHRPIDIVKCSDKVSEKCVQKAAETFEKNIDAASASTVVKASSETADILESKSEIKPQCGAINNSNTGDENFPDWFSMGRSDSVDGNALYPFLSIYAPHLKSTSKVDHSGSTEDENTSSSNVFNNDKSDSCTIQLQDSAVPKMKNCDILFHSSQEYGEHVAYPLPTDRMNVTLSVADCEQNLQEAKRKNNKDENVQAENKDYSFLLCIRNNSKKCRPSVKKRRRSKARMQETKPNKINVDISDSPNHDEKDNSKLSSSKSLTVVLGFDPSGNTCSASSSFLVSFSDSGTDSDFSSEDEGTFSDDQFDDFQFSEFASPLNLNVFCSVKKADCKDEENSKLKELNLAWKINIKTEECKSKPNRKVHFSDDKLVEVHPMIAWSYAYQAARKGPWEEYARDRERFGKRVNDMEKKLSPVLQTDHRQRVYSNLYE